jgi:kynurenine formamidase
MVQIRDLSVALKNGTFDPNDVKITHLSHAESSRRMAKGVCLPADLIGTDAFTLDIPIPKMVEELKKGNKAAFFPIHYAGREREYIHAEKPSNLETLPKPHGFTVAMFPIKIEGGAGGGGGRGNFSHIGRWGENT